MAEIILSQAGAVAGQTLLPQGLTVFGQTIGGAALGRTAGSVIGRLVDASLAAPIEGPRIESFAISESREGAPIPAAYGRSRVGGQVIWAARFKEQRNDSSAGKGGPQYSEYSYSISFAVALCEGPITRVDRVWANGESLSLSEFNWRLYRGSEDQLPDPLIEAIEGFGQAPAYRGTAYIVFEDLPLDQFGNRLPQLSFEVIRAGSDNPEAMPQKVRGVNIIPATGEFVYGTQIVRERQFPAIETPLNMNNSEGRADFDLSLDQLKSDLPNIEAANLAIAWFGDDLRAGQCKIRPGIETQSRSTTPYQWQVDGVERGDAYLISSTDGRANYGGTPADQAVLEGLAALHDAGIAVTMLPFLLMDVPPGNGLGDPYGAAEQAPFPWRGRITSFQDGTAAARSDIDAFMGVDGDFGYRHFILHHARLAAQAGTVEAFLIGSEMATLTRIRDGDGKFPFVEALVTLAADVRAILGPLVKVSYAADWTEYGSFVPADSSGDVLFPLDPLWGSPEIDFVGVDWYPPAGDWRDGDQHLDAIAGFSEADEEAYLLANMVGGEGYDWYYANQADRENQTRLPIQDGAYGEDWIFRQKDLQNWWQNDHFERPGGVKSSTSTSWQAGSKPVRLVEIGFPAIDRGGNAPNLFYDPKSAESAFPPFSSGTRDDLFQRRALDAALTFWQSQPFIEAAAVWAWDGRPWPYFPYLDEVWSDGANWQFGHWLNGRMGLIELASVIDDISLRSGVAINTDDVEGFLEGFSLSGRLSVRSALAPLEAAFGLQFIETNSVIRGIQASLVSPVEVDLGELVAGQNSKIFPTMDKIISRVSVNYISGNGAYEPAIATALSDENLAGEENIVSLPLVMSESRAESFAQSLLVSSEKKSSVDFALGPTGFELEPGDQITLDGVDRFKIEAVEKQALQVSVKAQHVSGTGGTLRFVDASPVGDIAPVPAAPEFFLIDIALEVPFLVGQTHVAASADPWRPNAAVRIGASLDSLETRAIIGSAAGIGQVQSGLPIGPLGRWDQQFGLEVSISDDVLPSFDEFSVLSGAGMLALQHNSGWELMAYSQAHLTEAGTWRLSGLLRGLNGTSISAIQPGSVLVKVDDRLVGLDIRASETNADLVWGVGTGQTKAFRFEDQLNAPLRVGHLRAAALSGGWQVSWTQRAREIVDDWSLPEAVNSGQFQVELSENGAVVSTESTLDTSLFVGHSYDSITVASVSAEGRVGPRVSIPLI